eukprot:g5624.t1
MERETDFKIPTRAEACLPVVQAGDTGEMPSGTGTIPANGKKDGQNRHDEGSVRVSRESATLPRCGALPRDGAGADRMRMAGGRDQKSDPAAVKASRSAPSKWKLFCSLVCTTLVPARPNFRQSSRNHRDQHQECSQPPSGRRCRLNASWTYLFILLAAIGFSALEQPLEIVTTKKITEFNPRMKDAKPDDEGKPLLDLFWLVVSLEVLWAALSTVRKFVAGYWTLILRKALTERALRRQFFPGYEIQRRRDLLAALGDERRRPRMDRIGGSHTSVSLGEEAGGDVREVDYHLVGGTHDHYSEPRSDRVLSIGERGPSFVGVRSRVSEQSFTMDSLAPPDYPDHTFDDTEIDFFASVSHHKLLAHPSLAAKLNLLDDIPDVPHRICQDIASFSEASPSFLLDGLLFQPCMAACYVKLLSDVLSPKAAVLLVLWNVLFLAVSFFFTRVVAQLRYSQSSLEARFRAAEADAWEHRREIRLLQGEQFEKRRMWRRVRKEVLTNQQSLILPKALLLGSASLANRVGQPLISLVVFYFGVLPLLEEDRAEGRPVDETKLVEVMSAGAVFAVKLRSVMKEMMQALTQDLGDLLGFWERVHEILESSKIAGNAISNSAEGMIPRPPDSGEEEPSTHFRNDGILKEESPDHTTGVTTGDQVVAGHPIQQEAGLKIQEGGSENDEDDVLLPLLLRADGDCPATPSKSHFGVSEFVDVTRSPTETDRMPPKDRLSPRATQEQQFSGEDREFAGEVPAVQSALDMPGRVSQCVSKKRSNVLLSVQNYELSISLEGTDVVLIRDCSFTVQSGRHVFISGESGCGKSTLLAQICDEWLRASCTSSVTELLVLPQRPYMVKDGSLADILFYGSSDWGVVTQSSTTSRRQRRLYREVAALAEDLGLIGLIRKIAAGAGIDSPKKVDGAGRAAILPEEDPFDYGYWTAVLAHPVQYLSLGEQQRLAAARVLLRLAQRAERTRHAASASASQVVTFVDEGTAHLDRKAAVTVYERLLNFPGNTVVSIGHLVPEEIRRKHQVLLEVYKEGDALEHKMKVMAMDGDEGKEAPEKDSGTPM